MPSDNKNKCGHCHAELSSGRCEYCGTWADTNFLGKAKKSVGIHPALAKRYANSKEPAVTKNVQKPTVGSVSPKNKKNILAQEAKPPSIPGYELMERIGKGAMGSVYRAKHLSSSRIAAVKILSAEMSSRSDLVARFERESAALSSLRHPNVVAIYDVGHASNIHYFCMEYLEGTTLRRLLKNGPISLEKSIKFIQQILLGLNAAHERGIIHRDLKPENVLVDQLQQRIVLVDFGLAGLLNESNPHPNLTRSQVTMGTVNYMAPEQHIDAKRVDHRSDLYSVGVLLYECMLGDLPLGRFALPSERGFEAPVLLDQIFSKALSREPNKRYQSAKEFADALEQLEKELENFEASAAEKTAEIYYLPSSEQVTENPTMWATVPPWVKKPGLSIGFVALALGLVLGVAFSKRHPNEVVVSAKGADAIYTGVELKALEKHWKSESPVWESDKTNLSYQARQGKAGHFRRDMSLLVEQDTTDGKDFSANLSMEHLKLPISPAKVQHFAREQLGAAPDTAAGGLFYVSADGYRALGVLAFPDGGCALAEYKKQDGVLKLVQKSEASCKLKNLNLEARLSPEKNKFEAFLRKKPLGSLEVKGLNQVKWQRALGCRNLNCSFEF